MQDEEAVMMMRRCAEELKQRRLQVERLTPHAEAFEVIRDIVRLLPRPSQGYGEDLVWALEKRIRELTAVPVKEASDDQ